MQFGAEGNMQTSANSVFPTRDQCLLAQDLEFGLVLLLILGQKAPLVKTGKSVNGYLHFMDIG